MPGTLILPAPNAFRSPFRNKDGSYDWETELNYAWDLLDSQSIGSLAAVIIEPILSSGGVIVLPDGYLKKMKEHCVKRGMLLILDEAQTGSFSNDYFFTASEHFTGVGRTGKNWAFEHHGVVPDILTLSKTLGAGLPLSAVVTSTEIEIEQKVYERGFSFLTTHVSDPLPAAVGVQVLTILERENLAAHAQRMGDKFQAGLRRLQEKYPCIGDVRGQGLMVGMEIVKPESGKAREPDEELGDKLADRMLELGLSANVVRMAGMASCFRMAPPLTVTEQELEEGLSIIQKALESLC
ncbi:pyridoxal phosphate-dependent transferase [Flagelloscypha sp. PMI_526]|nr:pyridoxal phosphate-dependent transferase [Flagelloscypha sp. PMI_526]